MWAYAKEVIMLNLASWTIHININADKGKYTIFNQIVSIALITVYLKKV